MRFQLREKRGSEGLGHGAVAMDLQSDELIWARVGTRHARVGISPIGWAAGEEWTTESRAKERADESAWARRAR
jgi:hypothetical protein